MNRVRASRYLLGFSLFTRLAWRLGAALSAGAALFGLLFLVWGPPDLGLLGYAGIMAGCTLVLRWCERALLGMYRRAI